MARAKKGDFLQNMIFKVFSNNYLKLYILFKKEMLQLIPFSNLLIRITVYGNFG